MSPQKWQGLEGIGPDPLLVNFDSAELLALPNYVLFAGLYGVLLWGITRCNPRIRRTFIVAVATFVTLEIAKWLFAIYSIANMTYHLMFIGGLIFAAMVLPLALMTRWAWIRSASLGNITQVGA
jgi:uncharacterized BrkB/YihY/UPF0761 family membrane protein